VRISPRRRTDPSRWPRSGPHTGPFWSDQRGTGPGCCRIPGGIDVSGSPRAGGTVLVRRGWRPLPRGGHAPRPGSARRRRLRPQRRGAQRHREGHGHEQSVCNDRPGHPRSLRSNCPTPCPDGHRIRPSAARPPARYARDAIASAPYTAPRPPGEAPIHRPLPTVSIGNCARVFLDPAGETARCVQAVPGIRSGIAPVGHGAGQRRTACRRKGGEV
jgi:hypothetical protein